MARQEPVRPSEAESSGTEVLPSHGNGDVADPLGKRTGAAGDHDNVRHSENDEGEGGKPEGE
jgi:hypothetical protein